MTPETGGAITPKDMLAAYLKAAEEEKEFLRERVRILERRQWAFFVVALGGYGLAALKQVGVI